MNHSITASLKTLVGPLAVSCILVSLLSWPLFCQTAQNAVRLQGTANFSTEFYHSSGIANRRTESESRAIVLGSLALTDYLVIPFELLLTSRQAAFQQPFNQIGISPQFFGWLTLHAGYYSARLSELTFGDSRLLGAGIEVRPGNFRFSFLYGRMQAPLEPDTARGIFGAYRRRAVGVKLGFGSEQASFIDLNVVRVVDDSSSISVSPVALPAYENAAASLAFGLPLWGDAVKVKGEVAVAAFTNDLRLQEKDVGLGFLKSLYTTRYSSQVDGAATLSLLLAPSRDFTLGVNGKWIGPGYVTLGYVQLQNDVFETTVTPSLRLFQDKVFLRGSVGIRNNNLRNNRFATTRRLLTALSASIQATSMFGVDVQYSSHSMNSSPKSDTLRIDNLMRYVSVAPRLSFELLGGVNTTVVSYSYQDFDDRNILAMPLNQNRTHSLVGIWTLALPSALSFTTSVSHTNARQAFRTKITTVNESVSHSLLDARLFGSIGISYSITETIARNSQVGAILNASYRFGQWGMLVLNVSVNTYRFGGTSTQPNVNESMAALQYVLSF